MMKFLLRQGVDRSYDEFGRFAIKRIEGSVIQIDAYKDPDRLDISVCEQYCWMSSFVLAIRLASGHCEESDGACLTLPSRVISDARNTQG